MHFSFALATLLPCLIVVLAAPFKEQGFGEGGFLTRRFNYVPDLPVGDLVPNAINPATKEEISDIHNEPIGNQLSPRNEDDSLLVQVRHGDDILGPVQSRNSEDDLLVQVKRSDDGLGA